MRTNRETADMNISGPDDASDTPPVTEQSSSEKSAPAQPVFNDGMLVGNDRSETKLKAILDQKRRNRIKKKPDIRDEINEKFPYPHSPTKVHKSFNSFFEN